MGLRDKGYWEEIFESHIHSRHWTDNENVLVFSIDIKSKRYLWQMFNKIMKQVLWKKAIMSVEFEKAKENNRVT